MRSKLILSIVWFFTAIALNVLYKPDFQFVPDTAAANMSLIPIADAFVSSQYGTTNYGTRTAVEVDGSPSKIAYIKFDLRSLSGNTISLAKFRYYVKEGSLATFRFREVANTTWEEATVTYNTRPALGVQVASQASPVTSSYVETNMTHYLKGKEGRIVTIAIDTAGTDGFSFYSKESSTNKPSLIVEYSAPVITGTAIAAAGDIACDTFASTASTCKFKETSDLVVDMNPAQVLVLGDIQYGSSTMETWMAYYHPTWGRLKSKTRPVLGNHEDNLTTYFDYFNGVGLLNGPAGERGKGYYSYNIAGWHVVALNSNCLEVPGGCAAGSPQERWLRADLAANPVKCTLAIWHHPYYTSGSRGPSSEVKPLVQALYDNNTDVLLTGHSHFYERFAPQDPNYNRDLARGIRSFTVGTGGKDIPGIGSTTFTNLEKRDGKSFGVLKMILGTGQYSWQFVPVPGSTFTDQGTFSCH